MTTQYGTAQDEFILKVRGSIDTDARLFFLENNWKDVRPTFGRFDSALLNTANKRTRNVDAFYVKSLAVWIPHVLIPNHVPTCPHCKRKDYVHVANARWINHPKILYGKDRHRYLDTLLYPCKACNRHFAGYNKSSMELDAKVYYGFFNFYLGHRFAVDEDLYRQIVEESTTESTENIARRLKNFAYAAFYDDHQLYL